jgi:FemAB-related protein (PEP-CTERM system-associated)
MKRDRPDLVAAAHAPLVIKELARGEEVRWEAFIFRCPQATFFHRVGWREVIEVVFHHRCHYLYAERAGEIVGVLPLAEVKSVLFGHAVRSLPFCVYGGAAVTDEAATPMLHAAARLVAHRLGASCLELRNRAPGTPDWPCQDLYVTFRKELLPEAEANMAAIPRKQRAMVRKGIKNRLSAQLDTSTDRFFALYADNVHRHGTPGLPQRYFDALARVFGRACEILTVVDPSGVPISSVLSFYFRDEVLPYYAGDHIRARELAANDFKYWELMRLASARGVRFFDFGRSKRGSGSFDFKKNWGFDPKPLHYEYCLFKGSAIPQNNPLNPKYRVLVALWKRLPIGLANAIGPYVVRSLG